ncbi:MAG: Pimeloyl-ACP methyl ester carboxylesterase [Hymenobacter sp.]|nr:Pimeloyl-ACP methyl ester carboxylesterase [Hymenobacter sp.]
MLAPYHSFFKDPPRAEAFLAAWVARLEALNHCRYQRLAVPTTLGTTVVWALNAGRTDWPALVVLPGFRTSGLFWDFDNSLAPLKATHRVFLVDVNGQPGPSDGHTPPVKTLDYGHWAASLLDGLGLATAAVAGASFGGLLGLKLALVAPARVSRLVLLNPGCLQPFSLGLKNLYYNLLPLAFPTEANVRRFLRGAVLCPGHHELSDAAMQLLVDFELFAIQQYQDHTQKPYAMTAAELAGLTVPVDLLLGAQDLLFPAARSLRAARARLPTLRRTLVLPNIGHGIETSPVALATLAGWLREEVPQPA